MSMINNTYNIYSAKFWCFFGNGNQYKCSRSETTQAIQGRQQWKFRDKRRRTDGGNDEQDEQDEEGVQLSEISLDSSISLLQEMLPHLQWRSKINSSICCSFSWIENLNHPKPIWSRWGVITSLAKLLQSPKNFGRNDGLESLMARLVQQLRFLHLYEPIKGPLKFRVFPNDDTPPSLSPFLDFGDLEGADKLLESFKTNTWILPDQGAVCDALFSPDFSLDIANPLSSPSAPIQIVDRELDLVVSALDLDEFRSPADIHDGKNKKKVWTEAERLKAKGAVPVLSLSEFSDQTFYFNYYNRFAESSSTLDLHFAIIKPLKSSDKTVFCDMPFTPETQPLLYRGQTQRRLETYDFLIIFLILAWKQIPHLPIR
ncbi:hypothetical protein BJ138DRAFT_1106861 [Hygrophoropsis aurantiaca]|uniref:Uncharacterized protein n=1 Tax=Hygrophoropsis aurantiaca TaxID=72124 RepID=A0ACB7ZTL8_9AGAM|nr:hypothetical protein BJ138DRAFT_1106861 [Hygrophoropsis aurantiaca]